MRPTAAPHRRTVQRHSGVAIFLPVRRRDRMEVRTVRGE
jgi:hypothetical protein